MVPRATREHAPHLLDTQLAVWESFARTRSVRATARELGADWRVVRQVIAMDEDRVRSMIDVHVEELVSRWEEHHEKVHGHIDALIDMVGAMIAEIRAAALEGRMTSILNKDGYPMPVVDAIQFIVMSRTLEQLSRIAGQAFDVSSAYRRGVAADRAVQGARQAAGGGGLYDFERMDDRQLADVIRQAGLKLPPLLERKVKLIESKSRPVVDQAG